MQTLEWSIKRSYPFESMVYGARSLFYKGNFLIFGGYGTSGPLNRIASYNSETDEWNQIGEMKSKRPYTSVIEDNNEFHCRGFVHKW